MSLVVKQQFYSETTFLVLNGCRMAKYKSEADATVGRLQM